jgi:two-component system sensor histidine kinase FlrB
MNVTQSNLLLDAFSSFTEASASLERAYWELLDKVEQLSEQLEQSNYYLTSVLQSLPCGVMVVNEQALVTSINQMAEEIFEVRQPLPIPLAEILKDASFSDRAADLNQAGGDFTEISVAKSGRVLQCIWSRMRKDERVLVVQDVTRMRRLEEQIQEAEKLAAKGEMALEVAHEIRNPLGALELFSSLLAEESLTPEEREQYQSNIQIGIRSLNTVLTNMLCFSRSPTPSRELIRVGDIVKEAVAFLNPLFEQRSVQVVTKCSDTELVALDAEMLRQILANLLTNALQALPEGGRIELETSLGSESVSVSVRDNGIGIPKGSRQDIFDSGFTTYEEGHGLGLAIVRRFVAAHGGTIDVESEEGQGTEFTLTFPRKSTGV